MNKPGTPNEKPSPVRQPVLLGLFIGTAVGAGYLLAGVPNVELMTLIVALAGTTMGSLAGAVVGGCAALIYSLASPLGLPVPLLLGGQVLGLGCAGLVGGKLGSGVVLLVRSSRRSAAIALSVALGLAATLVYDLLTNLAIAGAFDMSLKVVFVGAVPFALLHLAANGLVFAALFPLLAWRMQGLGRARLQGRGKVLTLALCLGLGLGLGDPALGQIPGRKKPSSKPSATRVPPRVATVDSLAQPQASPDSLRVVPPTSEPAGSLGWQRPLWYPFSTSLLQQLQWKTGWLTVQDGGLGAPAAILGEATGMMNPEVEIDGVPLGVGHALLDDPWLVNTQGLKLVNSHLGPDLRRGSDGQVVLATDDRSPASALSLYRGTKGPHETYHRGFSLLTPRAAWRISFAFEESLDNEGYNFSADPDEIFTAEEPFRGHAKLRSSRTRLVRQLDSESSLALEYFTGRKTKDSLPAWGTDHQEIWQARTVATMKSRAGNWLWRGAVFQENRDGRWGERPNATGVSSSSRLVEATRQGLVLDLVRAARDTADGASRVLTWSDPEMARGTGVSLRLSSWSLADSGAVWLPAEAPAMAGDGRDAILYLNSARKAGPLLAFGGLNLRAGSSGKPDLGGQVGFAQVGRRGSWDLEVSRTARTPRSDELLTSSRREVAGQSQYILANLDLESQKTLRLKGMGSLQFLGLNLALEGSLRRLTEGIVWEPLQTGGDTGRWENSLALDSWRVTGSVARQGRFLGWGRLKLEATGQGFDETSGAANLLPPSRYLRMEMMWENHFFKEDGILQLALYSTHRGEMSDPWDLTRSLVLPAATWHDLIVGFRLVGANLSLAIRNLTDQQIQWTAGALSPGREMDMRLHWYFHY